MWLINTTTLELEEFLVCPQDEYAILSHRWEDEELNFDEFRAGGGRKKKGFWKVRKCCKQAARDGLKYTWVDTCCIDKRSSAELTEAINSMFQWYQKSRVCYVYLSDVVLTNAVTFDPFVRSKWFKRAWTLQELLAPRNCEFYDESWTKFGNKVDLAGHILTAARIDSPWLRGRQLDECSIAERMSWAAGRHATRVEDIAYGLLGIFNVNMPLLYGEGEKAFQRLQEQILSRTDDETIFCWYSPKLCLSGLLAPNPGCFARSACFRPSLQESPRPPLTVTSRGIQITCQLIPWQLNVYLMLLHCESSSNNAIMCGIFLCQSVREGEYHRICIHVGDVPAVKSFGGGGLLSGGDPAYNPHFFIGSHRLGDKFFLRTILRTAVILPPSGLLHGQWMHTLRPSESTACHIRFRRTSYFDACPNESSKRRTFEETIPIDDLSIGACRSTYNDPFIDQIRIGFDLDFKPIFLLSIAFITESMSLGPLLDAQDCPVWSSDYNIQLIRVEDQGSATSIGGLENSKIWGFQGDRSRGFKVTLTVDHASRPGFDVSFIVRMQRLRNLGVAWACDLDVRISECTEKSLRKPFISYERPFCPSSDQSTKWDISKKKNNEAAGPEFRHMFYTAGPEFRHVFYTDPR